MSATSQSNIARYFRIIVSRRRRSENDVLPALSLQFLPLFSCHFFLPLIVNSTEGVRPIRDRAAISFSLIDVVMMDRTQWAARNPDDDLCKPYSRLRRSAFGWGGWAGCVSATSFGVRSAPNVRRRPARQWLGHHPPRCRGIERCFRSCGVQEATAPLADCPCGGRSASP